MPDGQSGVVESLAEGVNVERAPLVAPIFSTPQYERPSYVLEDFKWGSGPRGTTGGTITWAIVTTGQTYPANAEYTSQATPISSVFMPTIRAAFSRWDAVGNFTFVETTSPMTADMVVIFDELQAQSSDTVGLANTWSQGSEVTNSYISFDIGRRYRLMDGSVQTVGTSSSGGSVDFYTLVLHEVGHALGLDHEDNQQSVMSASQRTDITDLTVDDISAIHAIYGTPSGDDFSATTATTGVAVVGSTVTGSIETAGDTDWIRVTLTAGTLYRFDGRGSASSGGTLADPALQLLNAAGTVLIADNDSGPGADARIMFKAVTSGTYYLAMRANTSTATGTYTIAATANPDDYAASTATAGTVAVGGTATGIVETAGDRDWFRVTLTAGTAYNIQVSGTATGSALRWTDSNVVLRNADGTQVGANTRSSLGASALLTYTPTSTGTYYIDALAYSSGIGSYSVSVAPASAAQASALTAGDLAVVTAPPAISLDELPTQVARSTTVFVEGPLSAILTPPPADLFSLPAEQQNTFMAGHTPFEQLLRQQPSTGYNLLPF